LPETANVKDGSLKIFYVAGLIRRFYDGCALGEIYDKGPRCYDVLLSLLEDPQSIERVSEITKLSKNNIKDAAAKIVRLLLFNKRHDPFLSLGLLEGATMEETKKRWKRLLMVYHPDRSLDLHNNEEMAKGINQAYEDLMNLKNDAGLHRAYMQNISNEAMEFSLKTGLKDFPLRLKQYKYGKYLPAFILLVIVLFTIITAVLFIVQR
jgi:hypothetical protein